MNGYRKMIGDHILKTWDMGLRYCKCRTKYIDLLYNTYIRPIDTDYHSQSYKNKKKSEKVKQLTGHSKNMSGTKNTFADTIPFDKFRLTNMKEYKYWDIVDKWVTWFRKHGIYIEDEIKYYERNNISFEEAVVKLSKRYTRNNTNLAKFILKYNNYGNT